MNHFLVRVLGIVNGITAVAIVLFSTVFGGFGLSFAELFSQRGETAPLPPFSVNGAVLGATMGVISAAVICGLLAVAISIEKSLKHIATRPPWPENK